MIQRGNAYDQLVGIFYTHIDHRVRVGALKLICWEEAEPFQVIDLVKNISNIEPGNNRREYADLLLSVDEFKEMYGVDSDSLTYNGWLEKLISAAQ